MEQRFNSHCISLLGAPHQQKLLVAVSGGVDSVVLIHLLHKCGYALGIAHVNYKLRKTASDQDEAWVKNLAQSLHLPVYIKPAPLDPDESGIQEKARAIRYAWFNELLELQRYDYVLTAHHADDQIETLFMRLARGSGMEGLGGIHEKQGTLVRPLLPFFKKELIAYAKKNNLNWREDASNASTKYLRNTIRHTVMPSYLKLSQETAINTLTSMEYLRESTQAISFMVKQIHDTWVAEDDRTCIPLESISHLQPKRFWLHHLFSSYGFDAVEVEKLLHTHSGKQCQNTNYILIRERNHLVLKSAISHTDLSTKEYLVSKEGIEFPIRLVISKPPHTEPLSSDCALLDASKLCFPLVLRTWRSGDVFYPVGMDGKKKLSKFFKDEKMSAHEKQQQWLLCSKDQIVWILGKRINRNFMAHEESSSLQIKLI